MTKKPNRAAMRIMPAMPPTTGPAIHAELLSDPGSCVGEEVELLVGETVVTDGGKYTGFGIVVV